MIWQDLNPWTYVIWVELLTIIPSIVIHRVLFSFMFYYKKLMYIPDFSVQHSSTFKTSLENTIKGGTRHYVEPNWFNASLKPHSYFVLTLHIIYYLLSFISLVHAISLSLSSSISLSRESYAIPYS